MKIVVAPDSFKECLTAREVAQVLSEAWLERFPSAEVLPLPVADGGEGTLEALMAPLHAVRVPVQVHDPLGRIVEADFGLAGDTAVIEVAQACGIQLIAPYERNPFRADTCGVGELLLAARARGCKRFVIGLGGTVTCDGGAGMLSVNGIRELLQEVEVELLCDVMAPLTGPTGAVRLFGPQKGASSADVEVLENRMSQRACRMREETGKEVQAMPGAGAAGGLGAAFMAYANSTVYSGIERVLDLIHFREHLDGAALVITGEGRSDRQTLQGKAPLGVLRRASGAAHGGFGIASVPPGAQQMIPAVPVALISGRIDDSPALRAAGFKWLIEASPRDLPLAEALSPATARHHLRLALQNSAFPTSLS